MLDERDYAGDADMALLQALAVECWRLEGPYVSVAYGDPAWWMYQHLDKLAEVDVRLWLESGTCVAWGWLWRKERTLFHLTHPTQRALLEPILEWADALDVAVLEHDHESVELLRRRGYALRGSEPWINHMVRPLDAVPQPELPAGYSLRTVRGDDDLVARSDVHRAAFAPSRVVPESYRRVIRAPGYRSDLDHVVVAPDGTFAAFCLCWLDEVNGVGELEPVGTHPDHQRRGLATAVCRFALERLRQAGAHTALVYSKSGYHATALYERLGFRTISRHLEYRREQRTGSER